MLVAADCLRREAGKGQTRSNGLRSRIVCSQDSSGLQYRESGHWRENVRWTPLSGRRPPGSSRRRF